MSESPQLPQRPQARPPQQPAQPRAAARPARHDPRMSHVDGLREGKLKGDGYRPDRFHYVMVDKAAKQMGVDYYELLGYKIIRKDDGVKVTGRFRYDPDGCAEWNGHVLMAMPIEDFKRLEQEGPGGDGGLNRAAAVEKILIKKRANIVADTFRGLSVTEDHMQATVDGRVVNVNYDDE